MMKWYSVESIESTVAKSVDVEMIRHGIFNLPGESSNSVSFDNTNTEIIIRNNERGVIIDEWGKKKLETIASKRTFIIIIIYNSSFHVFYFYYYFYFFYLNHAILLLLL